MSHIKNSRFIMKEKKGWRVLDILSDSKGRASVKETLHKSNPTEKPFTRQGGLIRKAKQGT